MIHKRPALFPAVLLLAALTPLWAQTRHTAPEELLKTGIGFYGEGRFTEAATVLRLVEKESPLYPDALYWTALAELSSGDYGASLADLDALEKASPRSRWSPELPYHRGRNLFYLGRHEEALECLRTYSAAREPRIQESWIQESRVSESHDSRAASKRGAALYWMGESYFALGRMDSAEAAFSEVVEKYPSSVKYEAASYRLSLINQKKVEAELLDILKWSHEESLRTMEEYQHREKTYDMAIAAYQRRIAEMLAAENAGGTDQLAAAEGRIAALEASLAEANAALEELRGRGVETPDTGIRPPLGSREKALWILELKAAALGLSNTLNRRLNEGGE
ncbi:MAG: tetratricopeptide repeat protein [Treponema sp.]|jgi:tetratricopeptide (TPR) repeat protein|nr:tetratricopeptide repeat protein [Treponema sp.]